MSPALAAFSVSMIVLVVLALAGLAKMLNPEPTVSTLDSIGIALPNTGVRLLGFNEVALAAAAALTASPLFLALASLLHLGFTAVVVAVRRADRRRAMSGSGDGPVSCGCFGSSSAAPGLIHIVVTLVSAAVLARTTVLAVADAVALRDLFRDGLGYSLLTGGLILAGASMVILLLTRLAELFASFEPQPAAPTPLALR